jgi:hypothetical protein
MFAFIKETERKLLLTKLSKHSLDFICSGLLLIFCLLECYFCVERYIITDVSKDHGTFIFWIGLLILKRQALSFF